MEEIRAIVSGRVQMVMFRDFTKRGARRLGLTGYVYNRADGTVEVVAQGEPEALAKLIERIHRGSLLSRVDSVQVESRALSEAFTNFNIKF